MKILIAADMEGITGVVHWDHVSTSHPEYTRFRRLMTADVNAAIRGAFDGGASEVVVTDGHSSGRNILIEEIDSRARLNVGSPQPLSMVQGVDQGVAGVLFIGYHAQIGACCGILDHTWSDERVACLKINGRTYGETGLNAAVCGHFGVPVLMVSGDQTVCAEGCEFLGDIETAIVKTATGRMSAELLPPANTEQLIYNSAKLAVGRLYRNQAPKPFIVIPPIKIEISFVQSEMADRAMVMPGAERGNDRTVSYTAQDMVTAYGAFRALLALARG
jgi:D-amino peptidase